MLSGALRAVAARTYTLAARRLCAARLVSANRAVSVARHRPYERTDWP
jgi:hypothetical protein